MSSPPDLLADFPPTWREQWAVPASVDAERIRNRLEAVTARTLTGAEAAGQRHLAEAEPACRL